MKERFDRFTSSITTVYQNLQKMKMEEMKQYGLRSGHVDCLHILIEHPEGLTAKDIAQLSDLDKAAVSRYMNQMEEMAFAYVDESDEKIYRRKWFLSDKGMQAAQQMDAKIADAVSTIGHSLTEEERTAFYEMLNKVNTFMVNYLEEKR
jgi:DNA-binding MarR family transcriptional regulator